MEYSAYNAALDTIIDIRLTENNSPDAVFSSRANILYFDQLNCTGNSYLDDTADMFHEGPQSLFIARTNNRQFVITTGLKIPNVVAQSRINEYGECELYRETTPGFVMAAREVTLSFTLSGLPSIGTL